MVFQVESKTRQWIGLIIIGLVIVAMIFTGLIPQTIYKPYIAPFIGGFIYHIIRMLNTGNSGNSNVATQTTDPAKLKVISEVKPTQAQEG